MKFNIFNWFGKKLPEYITVSKKTYIVDTDAAYTHWINKIDLPVDQYSIEVVRQCVLEELESLAKGKLLSVKFTKSDEWKLSQHPVGKGSHLGATEYKQYYR